MPAWLTFLCNPVAFTMSDPRNRLGAPLNEYGESAPAPAVLPSALRSRIDRLLFKQIDVAPLVYFRILFGSIMLWEVTRYYSYDWIERYYIAPQFFFTYYGFSWIEPWPGNLMYVHFLGLGILAVFIILGLWYRASIILFSLGFTYVFLLDQANYLNHFYLVSWVGFLMIFVPAHRAVSLDVARKPELGVATVPAWRQGLLCGIVAIPYFFGGLAKINEDWLNGEPMRMWLRGATDLPLAGSFLTEAWAPYFFSYSGLLLDLFVVPALIWRRTRPLAVVALVGFHCLNAEIFSIGIFPWFMLLATPLFFDPRQLRFILYFERFLGGPASTNAALLPTEGQRRWAPAFLGVLVAYHVFMPLRHHLYPGNVHWTEEGHNWSWHMKLRDKRGSLRLTATDMQTGESWVINQRDYLTARQRRKMRTRPDLIVLFSHYLEKQLQKNGRGDIEIRAEARLSLNARPRRLLIDPTVDLTQVKPSTRPASWILPLETPLLVP